MKTGLAAAHARTVPAARRNVRGFTLIELMIVVLVIGVLAAIAMASYQFAVVKARRGDAQSCMQQHAQLMERFYTVNMTYAAAPAPDCDATVDPFYTVTFNGTPDARTYTIRAVPTTRQRDTRCGTLEMTHTGARTPLTAGCW